MTAVLLSGGIDSLVCAELARQAGELAVCVFVDYGHPAQVAEGWRAFAYAGSRGAPILAPLVHMDKTQVLRTAADIGLTAADAWPCYRGGPTPCGDCASCRESAGAWRVLEQDLTR